MSLSLVIYARETQIRLNFSVSLVHAPCVCHKNLVWQKIIYEIFMRWMGRHIGMSVVWREFSDFFGLLFWFWFFILLTAPKCVRQRHFGCSWTCVYICIYYLILPTLHDIPSSRIFANAHMTRFVFVFFYLNQNIRFLYDEMGSSYEVWRSLTLPNGKSTLRLALPGTPIFFAIAIIIDESLHIVALYSRKYHHNTTIIMNQKPKIHTLCVCVYVYAVALDVATL